MRPFVNTLSVQSEAAVSSRRREADAAKSGDEAVTLEALYARYARDVHRFSLYLCGSPSRAEDITSETFIRAWTAPGPIRQATVKAWLLTIARNIFAQQARHESRRSELDPELPDSAPGPERTAEQRERLRLVLGALQELPEIDRSALLMRAFDEIPYEEIARALDLSPAAVKVKVHRARLRLARSLKGEQKP